MKIKVIKGMAFQNTPYKANTILESDNFDDDILSDWLQNGVIEIMNDPKPIPEVIAENYLTKIDPPIEATKAQTREKATTKSKRAKR